MRSSLDNPFQPGSDVVPPVWAGRTQELSDWRDTLRPRLLAGLPERGRTILGEPGLGKSTLVRRIAEDAASHGDWVTPQIRIAVGTDPLKRLAAEALDLADQAGLASGRERRLETLLTRIESVAVRGTSLGLREPEGPEPHTALTQLLVEIGRSAIVRNVAVLVHIDEVQNITDPSALSQVLVGLGDAIAHSVEVEIPGLGPVPRQLPIAVYLTGLPEFDTASGTRHGATFARRFETTVLTPLSDEDLRAALNRLVTDGVEILDEQGGPGVVRLEPAAVEAIIALCQGEPFLFQLAGSRAWNAGTGSIVTREDVLTGWHRAEAEATAHVERILERLPSREHEFITAMAGLPPQERTLSHIAEAAGFARPTDAGPASQRLDRVRGIINRGRPYSFRHRAIEAYLSSDWPRLT